MGGDFAPEEIVLGGMQASRDFGIPIVLVGNEPRIREILGKQGVHDDGLIEVHHASQVIGMDEHPGMAYRKKKDASIVVAAKLVRNGMAAVRTAAYAESSGYT